MQEFFKIIEQAELSANDVRVLHRAYEDDVSAILVGPANLYDKGYVDDKGAVTEKGEELILKLEKLFKPVKKTAKQVLSLDAAERIKQFREIFPEIKIPTSGKAARSNEKSLETAFVWFFQNFKYDWDTILKATESYVEQYRKKNFKYMRTSQYFIRKQDNDKSWNSELADFCGMITSGEDSGIKEKNFSQKVV